MKSTFNICFYAKKDKQKANGAYPLFARITVDGVASRFNTKLDVLPSIWDGKMGKATGRTSEASRINRMLDDINASLNTIYHEMQRRDNYVTAEKVKNEFLGHSESHETILTLFQKHNDDVKQLVGISKTIATYRKYEVTRRHLAEFIQSKYNVSDISIKEISPMFITDFELYLRTACKCGYNTTAKFMQFFKRIIIIARNNGIWKIQCKLPPKTKRFCPLKTFNNAPLKSLDRWGYYYFSLFPSVCSHFTDTFSCQLNPVRRMYNTIHNGICYCRVSDCIIPIVRWQLRGDDDGLAPMSVLYYIEQDGSFFGIKVHKEEVIQYEQRAPFDSLEFRFQCAFYFCHLKRTHKFRSIRIICPYALLAGFIPHCCGKEALPGTG